ncbi:MAG: hypothetical protein KJN62_10200 [Deltaproteobacteria bacterium]|nr:hypothetical protein [Deltaproteobacteria bacterium]
MNPANMVDTLAKVLAEGKGVPASKGLKEAGAKYSEYSREYSRDTILNY